MKRTYFISALIVSVVVVGLSEPRGVTIVKDNVKRTWVNMFGDKERDVPSAKRHEGARRGSEDGELQVPDSMSPNIQRGQTPLETSESEYLKEIASVLSIPVLKDDTPGDIAFKIKQCIVNAERYRGEVLSDESFEKAKSSIRIPADAETFAKYHKFIKRIEGKKLLICGEDKEK